jgi:hypothetical protein
MKLSSSIAENKPMAPLAVKVADGPEELARCRALLQAEHGLGAGHPAGRQLWQWVSRSGQQEPVAVVIWAASAWHLKKRDEWIGWDAMKRSERLGLIVNNTRLLILEKSREPNLATQVLGAALRVLCEQWEQAHHYRPLLAEAFTDIETHHGTSYKASNWIALGHTAGFERHSSDFYVRHDRPKKLWIYPLHHDTQKRLCAAQLPAEHAAGEIAPTVRSPLSMPQMRSLREVFVALDDPRRINSRRYGLSLMLSLICMGLLCGARNLSDIVRSVQLLSQRERKALGLPRKKNSEVFRVPCYNALRELLPMIDLHQLLKLLTGWLTQHEGILPRTLALDGKDLGAQLGQIVSLINTTYSARGTKPGLEHDGTPAPPLAMAVAAGKGYEQAAALELLDRPEVELRGALLTADALHCQHATLHQIVAGKGGEYLVSLKDNQKKAAAYAREVLDVAPPLFAQTTKPMGG